MLPSVIIAIICDNDEKTIYDCLLAAGEQDYPNKEIFVIDNCSSDSSWLKIEQASKIIGPKTVYNKVDKKYTHGGLKNFIIKSANADIYAIIPGYVIVDKSKVSVAVNAIIENAADLIYNDYMWQDIYMPTGSYNKDMMMKFPFWPSSYCITKRALDKIGGYNEKINGVEDYDMLLRLTDIGLALHVPKPLEEQRPKKIDEQIINNIQFVLQNYRANG